ncbi:hypothetical protein NXV33_11970 [Bacteroides thetaiotaomicron]|nr:hypothetical protein [Bacteroides thetaiotaomicron]
MNLTDHIINVALLGTATRELITTDFPEELQETLRDIQAKAEDAEALFYQQSALGFAFARAGVEAQSIAGVTNVTEARKKTNLTSSVKWESCLLPCISIKISIFCCMLIGELPTKEN